MNNMTVMRESLRRRGILALAMTTVLAAGVSACGSASNDSATSDSSAETSAATTSAANAPKGSPITIGVMNQEGDPTGSYTEATAAMEAAAAYVNDELDGIDGHPLKLSICRTKATPESAQSCANRFVQEGVPLVANGILFTGAAAYPILEQAGIPVIPTNGTTPAHLTTTDGYTWFTGSLQSAAAAGEYVKDYLKAKRVALVYADNAAGKATVLPFLYAMKHYGIEVTQVPGDPAAADYTPDLTTAMKDDPDALVVFYASQGCAGVMRARQSLGIQIPTVGLTLCAGTKTLEAAGAAAYGWDIVSPGPWPENPDEDPQVKEYVDAMQKYASDPDLGGTAPLGFGTIMTLRDIITKVGADNLTGERMMAFMKNAKDVPAFMAAPFSCGEYEGFPAVCGGGDRVYRDENGTFVDVADGKYLGTDMSLYLQAYLQQ
jgi:branched-chain amino acid transport system substrate-binding protein